MVCKKHNVLVSSYGECVKCAIDERDKLRRENRKLKAMVEGLKGVDFEDT